MADILAPEAISTDSVVSPVDVVGAAQLLAPQALITGGAMTFALLLAPFEGGLDAGLSIRDVTAIGTEVDTLPTAHKIRWQDQLSEAGSGSFAVPLGAAELAELSHGRLVMMSYRGTAAWTLLLEQRKTFVRAQGEEHDQVVEWSGRGHLAVLERAVVYPSGGVGRTPIEDERLFSWQAPSYDDSAWGFAKELETIGDAKGNWAGLTQSPAAARDFDDDGAFVLWADPYTYVTAPPGNAYFRQLFTVPNTGSYIITVIQDDWGPVYIDGFHQADQMSNFIQAQQYQVQLSAGTHLIASRVLNFFIADPAHNPGGFAFSVADNLNGRPGTVQAHSDASCRIIAYVDEPPGMTPGRVMRLVVEEARARGCFPWGLTLNFTDTTDTAGMPWPTVADIATTVGNDLLTFFRELSGTYIDMWMEPSSMTFDAWNIGTRGTAVAADFHSPTDPLDPTSGNLTSLTVTDSI